jgi:hypothetical protein
MMITGIPILTSCFVLQKVPDSAVTMLKILLNNNGEQESSLKGKYVCRDAVVSVLE